MPSLAASARGGRGEPRGWAGWWAGAGRGHARVGGGRPGACPGSPSSRGAIARRSAAPRPSAPPPPHSQEPVSRHAHPPDPPRQRHPAPNLPREGLPHRAVGLERAVHGRRAALGGHAGGSQVAELGDAAGEGRVGEVERLLPPAGHNLLVLDLRGAENGARTRAPCGARGTIADEASRGATSRGEMPGARLHTLAHHWGLARIAAESVTICRAARSSGARTALGPCQKTDGNRPSWSYGEPFPHPDEEWRQAKPIEPWGSASIQCSECGFAAASDVDDMWLARAGGRVGVVRGTTTEVLRPCTVVRSDPGSPNPVGRRHEIMPLLYSSLRPLVPFCRPITAFLHPLSRPGLAVARLSAISERVRE